MAMAAIRCPQTWIEWKPRVLTVAVLFAVGIYASGPFLHGTYVGTGESYNYSLSIADAVTQERSGVFPVLVGQSEYAFNGRVHPLRTAPWYCCSACLLDMATFHSLNFWQLQDAVLVLSLVGAAFSAYASLRLLCGSSRLVALFGSVFFVLSPGVISTAYAMDLYMTVTTLPLVPIVAAANLAAFSRRTVGVYLALGGSVGLAWLTHPPTALWLSTATAFIQSVVWLSRRPSLRAVGAVIPGLAACFLLAGFSFASSSAMHQVGALSMAEDFSPLYAEVARAFPASLLPVSSEARSLGDFQLGYAGWLLLIAACVLAVRRRSLGAVALLAFALFGLVLTLPVPGLTNSIWRHLPTVFPKLTNIWPMQRLYLVATGLILAAAGSIWAGADRSILGSVKWRQVAVALLAAALVWQVYQARLFVKRGDLLRHSGTESADLHRSENINLTVTSYALLDVPSHYINGVMDAEREFRLLRASDKSEIANNWTPAKPGRLRAQGIFYTTNIDLVPTPLAPEIRIEPTKRYLLSFKFMTPPFNGFLEVTGDHFRRDYPLPSAGERRGFGMNPGNDNTVELWTTNADDIQLQLSLVGMKQNGALGAFELREVEPASFPVELDGYIPLSGRVNSHEDAWLETPRRFIPGYEAAVDGKPVALSNSPEGSVMLRVPAGEHTFQVSYRGSPLLLGAFWVSFSTAALLGLGMMAYLAVAAWNQWSGTRKSRMDSIRPAQG